MDDNYLDEVLPRWQFWKEFLIDQTEEVMRSFKEGSGVFKLCTEVLEKVKKIEAAEDLKKIQKEIEGCIRLLELTRFRNAMNKKNEQTEKQ